MRTIFLLFEGSSPDGFGKCDFVCRTTSIKTAKKHYDRCQRNPYSTGCVYYLTEKTFDMINMFTDWENLKNAN